MRRRHALAAPASGVRRPSCESKYLRVVNNVIIRKLAYVCERFVMVIATHLQGHNHLSDVGDEEGAGEPAVRCDQFQRSSRTEMRSNGRHKCNLKSIKCYSPTS